MQVNSAILLQSRMDCFYDRFFGHRLVPFLGGLAMTFSASPRPNCRENKMDDKGEKDEQHQV